MRRKRSDHVLSMIPNVLSMIPHVLSMMSFGTLYKAASPSFETQNFEKFLLAKSC